MRGVPLRLEIGPRDLDAGQVTAVTRTGTRSVIGRDMVVEGVHRLLDSVRADLLSRAGSHVQAHLRRVSSLEEACEAVGKGAALVGWCGDRECAITVEGATGGSILGTDVRSPFVTGESGPCVICRKSGTTTLVGRAY
jgi:prolyl-tRNA synthetase